MINKAELEAFTREAAKTIRTEKDRKQWDGLLQKSRLPGYSRSLAKMDHAHQELEIRLEPVYD